MVLKNLRNTRALAQIFLCVALPTRRYLALDRSVQIITNWRTSQDSDIVRAAATHCECHDGSDGESKSAAVGRWLQTQGLQCDAEAEHIYVSAWLGRFRASGVAQSSSCAAAEIQSASMTTACRGSVHTGREHEAAAPCF